MVKRKGRQLAWRRGIGVRNGLAVLIGLALLAPGLARAQVEPEQSGVRFNRSAVKSLETLAQKAGGPTERIEIQSTSDNRDYVVKTYVLKQANASEVFELIQTAVEL